MRRFNERGIDGLTEGPRSGRPPKIMGDRTDEYRKLVLHPELVNETHWTGRKFQRRIEADPEALRSMTLFPYLDLIEH